MTDANITKEYNVSASALPVYQTLTKSERNRLARMILGKNNLKAAYLACECSEGTIKRAIAGMNMLPETAAKIRAFLNPADTTKERS